MTSIENVSGEGAASTFPQDGEALSFSDINISSKSRPNICTAFEEIQHNSVILSDGSKWTVSNKNPTDTMNKVTQLWKRGDDIRLKRYYKGVHAGFIMYNVRADQALLVRSSKKCADISKAFFIAEVDPSGYALKTTDGKTWVTGFAGAFSTRRWKEGERVIINQSTHIKNDYEMINPHTKSNAWVTEVFRKA
ncbi:MAG: hypothetical protein KFB93_02055 [Simkaniaceae bacterium]|jgi:hypothetical protein|nr:MAG: hypothetical protein KFB93_02055 [Simkaniaceae bacterium]